jgi:hypothetical protein
LIAPRRRAEKALVAAIDQLAEILAFTGFPKSIGTRSGRPTPRSASTGRSVAEPTRWVPSPTGRACFAWWARSGREPPRVGRHPPLRERRRPPSPRSCHRHHGAARTGRVDQRRG